MNGKFDAVMEGLVDRAGPGAAVGVRHGDEAPYLAGFGLADVEWGLSMPPDAVFRLGSITKQFTAAAIMLLVEDGRLGLDDDIGSVFADFPGEVRRATIRHLLNHTSGIANFNSRPDFPERTDLTLTEVVGLFKDLPPDFAPGDRYLYSNSGYVLLGAVIETLSGMPYRTFLLERFFRPLGMRHTRYLYDEPIVAKRARGYRVGAKGVENARTMSMTLPHAAGALGSSVGDLLTWTQALRGGRAVSADSYAAMIAPARLNDGSLSEYGFGLSAMKFRDRTAITHAGGINGFATLMAHFQEDDLTVVVLANLETFPVERALLALTRQALHLSELPARPRIAVAPEDLARCAGVYELDASPWPIEIAAADGALIAPFPGPDSRFEPFARTEFECVGDPELTLSFDRPGVAGFERVAIEGAMRRLRTTTGIRVAPRAAAAL